MKEGGDLRLFLVLFLVAFILFVSVFSASVVDAAKLKVRGVKAGTGVWAASEPDEYGIVETNHCNWLNRDYEIGDSSYNWYYGDARGCSLSYGASDPPYLSTVYGDLMYADGRRWIASAYIVKDLSERGVESYITASLRFVSEGIKPDGSFTNLKISPSQSEFYYERWENRAICLSSLCGPFSVIPICSGCALDGTKLIAKDSVSNCDLTEATVEVVGFDKACGDLDPGTFTHIEKVSGTDQYLPPYFSYPDGGKQFVDIGASNCDAILTSYAPFDHVPSADGNGCDIYFNNLDYKGGGSSIFGNRAVFHSRSPLILLKYRPSGQSEVGVMFDASYDPFGLSQYQTPVSIGFGMKFSKTSQASEVISSRGINEYSNYVPSEMTPVEVSTEIDSHKRFVLVADAWLSAKQIGQGASSCSDWVVKAVIRDYFQNSEDFTSKCGGITTTTPTEDTSPKENECKDGEKRECYTGSTATAGVGICMKGFNSCLFGKWQTMSDGGYMCFNEVTPGKEICDGIDNDCNNVVDDKSFADLDCADKNKGSDGNPDTSYKCSSGKCVKECVPNCNGKECGSDSCLGVCGTCVDGKTCGTDGKCAVIKECSSGNPGVKATSQSDCNSKSVKEDKKYTFTGPTGTPPCDCVEKKCDKSMVGQQIASDCKTGQTFQDYPTCTCTDSPVIPVKCDESAGSMCASDATCKKLLGEKPDAVSRTFCNPQTCTCASRVCSKSSLSGHPPDECDGDYDCQTKYGIDYVCDPLSCKCTPGVCGPGVGGGKVKSDCQSGETFFGYPVCKCDYGAPLFSVVRDNTKKRVIDTGDQLITDPTKKTDYVYLESTDKFYCDLDFLGEGYFSGESLLRRGYKIAQTEVSAPSLGKYASTTLDSIYLEAKDDNGKTIKYYLSNQDRSPILNRWKWYSIDQNLLYNGPVNDPNNVFSKQDFFDYQANAGDFFGREVTCNVQLIAPSETYKSGVYETRTSKPVVIIPRNIKNPDYYKKISKALFLFSDVDWKKALQYMPVINTVKDIGGTNCLNILTNSLQSFSSTSKSKCSYPLIVYNSPTLAENSKSKMEISSEKSWALKIDSSIDDFLGKSNLYTPDTIFISDILDKKYINAPKGAVFDSRISSSYGSAVSSAWKNYGVVILVNKDDSEALIKAAELGVFFDAPIAIADDSDSNFKDLISNKLVISVGSSKKGFDVVGLDNKPSSILKDNFKTSVGLIYNTPSKKLNPTTLVGNVGQTFSTFIKSPDKISTVEDFLIVAKKPEYIAFVNPNDIDSKFCKPSVDHCKTSISSAILASSDAWTSHFVSVDSPWDSSNVQSASCSASSEDTLLARASILTGDQEKIFKNVRDGIRSYVDIFTGLAGATPTGAAILASPTQIGTEQVFVRSCSGYCKEYSNIDLLTKQYFLDDDGKPLPKLDPADVFRAYSFDIANTFSYSNKLIFDAKPQCPQMSLEGGYANNAVNKLPSYVGYLFGMVNSDWNPSWLLKYDADSVISRSYNGGKVFKSPADLELFLQKQPLTRIKGNNGDLLSCYLQYPWHLSYGGEGFKLKMSDFKINDDKQKAAIVYYYWLMNGIRYGSLGAYESIATIDSFLQKTKGTPGYMSEPSDSSTEWLRKYFKDDITIKISELKSQGALKEGPEKFDNLVQEVSWGLSMRQYFLDKKNEKAVACGRYIALIERDYAKWYRNKPIDFFVDCYGTGKQEHGIDDYTSNLGERPEVPLEVRNKMGALVRDAMNSNAEYRKFNEIFKALYPMAFATKFEKSVKSYYEGRPTKESEFPYFLAQTLIEQKKSFNSQIDLGKVPKTFSLTSEGYLGKVQSVVRNALKEQLLENRKEMVKYIQDANDAIECIHTDAVGMDPLKGHYNKCKENVDNVLKRSPTVSDFTSQRLIRLKNNPSQANSDAETILSQKEITASYYLKTMPDVVDMTKLNEEAKEVVTNFAISAGLTIATMGMSQAIINARTFIALQKVPGITAVGRGAAVLRAAIVLGPDAYFAFEGISNANKVCSDVNINQLDSVIGGGINTQQKYTLGPNVISDYSACHTAIFMASVNFVTMAPFWIGKPDLRVVNQFSKSYSNNVLVKALARQDDAIQKIAVAESKLNIVKKNSKSTHDEIVAAEKEVTKAENVAKTVWKNEVLTAARGEALPFLPNSVDDLVNSAGNSIWKPISTSKKDIKITPNVLDEAKIAQFLAQQKKVNPNFVPVWEKLIAHMRERSIVPQEVYDSALREATLALRRELEAHPDVPYIVLWDDGPRKSGRFIFEKAQEDLQGLRPPALKIYTDDVGLMVLKDEICKLRAKGKDPIIVVMDDAIYTGEQIGFTTSKVRKIYESLGADNPEIFLASPLVSSLAENRLVSIPGVKLFTSGKSKEYMKSIKEILTPQEMDILSLGSQQYATLTILPTKFADSVSVYDFLANKVLKYDYETYQRYVPYKMIGNYRTEEFNQFTQYDDAIRKWLARKKDNLVDAYNDGTLQVPFKPSPSPGGPGAATPPSVSPPSTTTTPVIGDTGYATPVPVTKVTDPSYTGTGVMEPPIIPIPVPKPVPVKCPVIDFSPKAASLYSLVDDDAIVSLAESVIGREITDSKMRQAIINAHNELDNTKKAKILLDAGFNSTIPRSDPLSGEVRKLLDSGVCGPLDYSKILPYMVRSNFKTEFADAWTKTSGFFVNPRDQTKGFLIGKVTSGDSGPVLQSIYGDNQVLLNFYGSHLASVPVAVKTKLKPGADIEQLLINLDYKFAGPNNEANFIDTLIKKGFDKPKTLKSGRAVKNRAIDIEITYPAPDATGKMVDYVQEFELEFDSSSYSSAVAASRSGCSVNLELTHIFPNKNAVRLP